MPTDREIIIRRKTFDDVFVCGWDDGAITSPLGYAVKGVPVVRPRTEEAVERERAVMWLFLGEVCLYEYDELADLHKACRKAVKKHGIRATGGDVRTILSEPTKIPLSWIVTSADRDGKATEKQCRFRMGKLAGIAVFWTRGRGYETGRIVNDARSADPAFVADGCRFTNLRDLNRHLSEVADLNGDPLASSVYFC